MIKNELQITIIYFYITHKKISPFRNDLKKITISSEGFITDFIITPANIDDREAV